MSYGSAAHLPAFRTSTETRRLSRAGECSKVLFPDDFEVDLNDDDAERDVLFMLVDKVDLGE